MDGNPYIEMNLWCVLVSILIHENQQITGHEKTDPGNWVGPHSVFQANMHAYYIKSIEYVLNSFTFFVCKLRVVWGVCLPL